MLQLVGITFFTFGAIWLHMPPDAGFLRAIASCWLVYPDSAQAVASCHFGSSMLWAAAHMVTGIDQGPCPLPVVFSGLPWH